MRGKPGLETRGGSWEHCRLLTEDRIAGRDGFLAEPGTEDGGEPGERGQSWIEMAVQADGGEPVGSSRVQGLSGRMNGLRF